MSENRPKRCPVCGIPSHSGSCIAFVGQLVRFLMEQQCSLEQRIAKLEATKETTTSP